MFKEIKEKVLERIKDKNVEQVDTDTNNKNIGIYMLYIDNFEDNKIIPIYIGQTGCGRNRNFQSRYNEHLQELMALNRLEYDYYRELFFKNFYDGHFKACKIFKYMVDHECTLKDFHMIVLEKIDGNLPEKKLKEFLDEREQFYFKEYLPAFFGFNQINTVIQINMERDSFRYGIVSSKLVQYDLEDCENFLKYFGYGYTKFNYYHCYPKTPVIKENYSPLTKNLTNKKDLLYRKHFVETNLEKYALKKVALDKRDKKYFENIKKHEDIWKNNFKPLITQWCQEHKISKPKTEDIYKEIVYSEDKEKIQELEDYFKKKKVKTSIIDIFNKNPKVIAWREKEIKLLREKVQINNELYECMHPERTEDLKLIFPTKRYFVLPLKDKYTKFKFDNLKNNEMLINFEFSNNGLGYFDYDIIKIDYKFNINNKIGEKKDIFINPQHTYHDYWKYYEKSDGAEFQLRRTPFNIICYENHISTTMELKNGINEYTLMNKRKYNLSDILDKLNSLINSDTSVKVSIRSGMRNKCVSLLDDYYKKDNLLKNKILLSLK